MIEIHKSPKGTDIVYASDLHITLEIETKFNTWFPRMKGYLEENQDYYKVLKKPKCVINSETPAGKGSKKKVGRKSIDYILTVDAAKEIAFIQKTPIGKKLRRYLLDTEKKVVTGLLISPEQSQLLFELVEGLELVSVQKDLERKHFEVTNKDEAWWNTRARLFGQTTHDLKKAMEEVGKKYKNQRQALIHLDPHEIIRRAAIDLFKVLGKDDETAVNLGNWVKSYSKRVGGTIYNDEGAAINYLTPKQEMLKIELADPKRSKLLKSA